MRRRPAGRPAVAVVGLAGRFPKAPNVAAFWRNLCAGLEGITFFPPPPPATPATPPPADSGAWVGARGLLEGADLFDASLFGINPREAELMDPQHRLFLECGWEALEHAGYDPSRYAGAIGVFAGASLPTYLLHNLASRPERAALAGEQAVMFANDKDFLATRVSYKLDLRGPSLNIQTACSTSLVAVVVACQHLLTYQCDMALAGGVALTFPQQRAYRYQTGGIASPDGHCRAFDAQAAGAVPGEGVAAVVLKRLADAEEDGDQVYAVIKGFALNNDGARKAGYAAPSVEGQAEVIALAQAMAGFEPDTIGLLEAHGTGTPVGDPIEVAGLMRVFNQKGRGTARCALGSVKTNIGHLDTAAGIAGFIKATLALHHQQLPPTLHFQSPNPQLNLATSPFYVNTTLVPWAPGPAPRRAGVSSFGIGGTNAHVVLEEALAVAPLASPRAPQLLVWSAKTSAALEMATGRLREHLQGQDPGLLADVAWTLQTGRRAFPHRRILVAQAPAEAVAALSDPGKGGVLTAQAPTHAPVLVYLFPGQGAQRADMGRELYHQEPVFRQEVDRCADLLRAELSLDLRTLLYPAPGSEALRAEKLTDTALAQPALFVIEYALAQLGRSVGLQPRALVGHSSGEYVAGCLAGVFSLEDALRLVATRGRLMQQLPRGAMLAVLASEAELRPRLSGALALAAVNGPRQCVVAGPPEAIDGLKPQLAGAGVACRLLPTSHAFHSPMMDPILAPFATVVGGMTLKPPQLPLVSSVTGRWLTPAEATDPAYWVRHIRETTRFAAALELVLTEPDLRLVEMGPGRALTGLVREHPRRQPNHHALPALASAAGDRAGWLTTVGQLWLSGLLIDWAALHAGERRRRVPLPTYPFERKRYWIEPSAPSPAPPAEGTQAAPEPTPAREATATPAATVTPAVPATRPAEDPILTTLTAAVLELSGLPVAEVRPDATFLEMGFDSLFLTQVSQRITQLFQVQVPFRTLLDEVPTLSQLAAHLREATRLEPGAPRCSPEGEAPAGRTDEVNVAALDAAVQTSSAAEGPLATGVASGPAEPANWVLPLTEGQRDLWFAAQVSDQASCAFNESCLLRLSGALDARALKQALQAVVERHEALRATFALTGEHQRIAPAFELAVPLVALAGLPPAERDARVEQLLAQAVSQPFDLVQGPLLRVCLIQAAADEHLLILTCHHLVCDGQALGLLLQDLGAVYAALAQGQPPPPPASARFQDYVRRQADLERQAQGTEAAYWLQEFAGPLPALELPLDRPRPPAQSFRGARESRSLPPALSQALRRWSTQHGATLFTCLLAGYCALLQRLTNQAELIVGVPTSGRSGPGETHVVGHCITFLPLRLRAASSTSVLGLLSHVKDSFYNALDHRNFSFGRLVQQLGLPRDPSRSPLVSATFTLGQGGGRINFGPLTAVALPNPHVFSSFDLSVSVLDTEQGLVIDGRYNADLFERATIARWLKHFETLLTGLTAEPGQEVGRLPVLDTAERQRVVVEWNQTRLAYPTDLCLHHLIERQSRRTPEAVAVMGGAVALRYRELEDRANQWAAELHRNGVGPEAVVGVCLDRSADLLVGLLAVLKAGGAYLPLDPELPAERLAFMCADSGATVLLTERRWAERFAPRPARVVVFDTTPPRGVTETPAAPRWPQPKAHPDNLMYVIYTSGSTGQPKGVMVTHRNAVNCLHGLRERLEVTPADVLLAITTLSFDIAALELFLPLTLGARVVVANRETAADGHALANLLANSRATLLQATPPTWRMLLEAGWTGGPGLKLLSGGEALPRPLADELLRGGAVVWNLYGPTETTIWSAAHRVERGTGPVPIGRPLPNTQLYVLDENRQPTPVGVEGELYIGGDGVARGYLNRAALTAQRFLPDTLTGQPGARLYRTGDRARFRPEGTLEFLGRRDHQIKLHGHRIELEEIEAALTAHPGVRHAVSLLRDDTPIGAALVAYVVASGAPPPTPEALRQHLRQHLPSYMVPSAFVFLERLPLTPNGKVDRRALPPPEPNVAVGARPRVLPQTRTEQLLADLWQELLQVEAVSATDNFFDLGGHSVLATQLMSRLRQTLGVELGVRALFETPVLAELARAVDHGLAAADHRHQEVRPPVNAVEARRLLGQVETLSDAAVEALLQQLEPETELTQ